MLGEPLMANQTNPYSHGNNVVKKDVRTILILAFVVVIVVVFLIAVILSGRTVVPSAHSPSATPTPYPTPPISQAPTLTPKMTPSPTPTTTPVPTQPPASSLTVVSVDLLQPYNPGGPTIEVTLQNVGNEPVTSLQAVLSLPGDNYTYTFSDVSSSKPLLPGQSASQTQTLLNAGFDQNQTYLLEIIGYEQNGGKIDYVTPINILTSTASTGTAGNGELQLSLALEKTVYSLGEPVNLTVMLTNISGQNLNYTHTGLDFDFRVYNDTNSLVYQWSNFIAIPQFITIEPFPAGESMEQNFTWQQTCNFNISVIGDQVSAGTYYIIGLTGPTYGLQTAPIQITIVNP